MSDVVAALTPVADVLDRLGVPFHLGGSVASSVYGMARATMDVDLVAALAPRHVAGFVAALQEDYYVDVDQIQRALATRSSFNVIHQPTVFKVDVFLPKQRPYDEQAMARRTEQLLDDDPQARSFPVATPEDVMLAKLDWFVRGGRTSERQWSDVLGVLRVQGDGLDAAYLRRWAKELGLEELWNRALAEAGS